MLCNMNKLLNKKKKKLKCTGGPRLEFRHGHLRKICLPKVVLDNDHLQSLDYEYGNGALEYVKYSSGALQI